MTDQWYAIHDASGQLVSTGTVLADPLPAGLTALPIDGPPDFGRDEWDPATLAFNRRPTVTYNSLKMADVEQEWSARLARRDGNSRTPPWKRG